MTQDNRFSNDGIIAERVVTEAPVLNPIRRAHPGLWPLALSSLLGLLSMFLPFASIASIFNRNGVDYAAGQTFSFWRLGTGGHGFLLFLLLLAAILAAVAYFTRAAWARYLAGILGLISGLWLLVNSLFRFSHSGLGNFFGTGLTEALTSGIGRWLMALAGLALLATALWSLLRNVGDRLTD
jgi:hypothetical protein